MITVLRAYGLRVVIYRLDHWPPHVHVIGDGEAKIELLPDGSARLISANGMKAGDIRKAVAAVTEEFDLLMQMWSDLHG